MRTDTITAATGPIDVRAGIAAVLRSKKRTYPQHVNRISAMDDPCLRRLYYRRAAWDKAEPTPDSLQGVFETGNILEPVIERIVSEVGQVSMPRWRIVGSQMPTNSRLLKDYQISGTIDGFLQVQSVESMAWETVGVVDLKTMSPNIYPQINSYDDLGKYPWTRAYRGQLQLYAVANELRHCYILAVNKQNLYDFKLIDFPVDDEYVAGLLEKAAAVNAALKREEPPEGINDPDICRRCAWYSYCAPSIEIGGNLKVVDNAELEAVLDRIAELKEAAGEYAALEKHRDALLTKGQDIAVGRWMVSWKEITVNRQARPATTATQWRKKIVAMN